MKCDTAMRGAARAFFLPFTLLFLVVSTAAVRALEPNTVAVAAHCATVAARRVGERIGVQGCDMGGSSRVCYRKGGVVRPASPRNPVVVLRRTRSGLQQAYVLYRSNPRLALVNLAVYATIAFENQVWWTVLLLSLIHI